MEDFTSIRILIFLIAFGLGALTTYFYHRKRFYRFTPKEIKKVIMGMSNGDISLQDYIYIRNTVYANENKLNLHKQTYYVGHDGLEPQQPLFTNEEERQAYAMDYILNGFRNKGIVLTPDETRLKEIEELAKAKTASVLDSE